MSMAERMKAMEVRLSDMAKRLDAIEQAFDEAEEEDSQPTHALDGSYSGRDRDDSRPL